MVYHTMLMWEIKLTKHKGRVDRFDKENVNVT